MRSYIDGILVIKTGTFVAHNAYLSDESGIASFIFSLFKHLSDIKLADMNWLHYIVLLRR